MSVSEFWESTLGEIITIINGHYDFQNRLYITTWEQSRWIAYATVASRKTRKGPMPSMQSLMPFSWDKDGTPQRKLTPEEWEAKKLLFEKQEKAVFGWQQKT